jgi:hypothetical protein
MANERASSNETIFWVFGACLRPGAERCEARLYRLGHRSKVFESRLGKDYLESRAFLAAQTRKNRWTKELSCL